MSAALLPSGAVPAARVVAEARTWIGTPYHHQGREKLVACDCVGLLIGVGEALGQRIVPPAPYGRWPPVEVMAELMMRYLTEVPLAALGPGDVVRINVRRRGPTHAAILAQDRNGRLTQIHAWAPRREVIEDYPQKAAWVAGYRWTWDKIEKAPF